MTEEQAKQKLSEKIEEMKKPTSKVIYAAILQDEKDKTLYKLEYGTNDGTGTNYHVETSVTEEEKKIFREKMRLEYSLNEDGSKDIIGVVTETSMGKLLSSFYEPVEEFVRPIKAGIGISDITSKEKTGTLGGIFLGSQNNQTALYVISNMHVLAKYPETYNQWVPTKDQEDVVQPSEKSRESINLKKADYKIATTVWKQFGPEVDVAIAKICCNHDAVKGFYNSAFKMNPFVEEFEINTAASKLGYKTGLTTAKIKSKHAAIRIENPFTKVNGLKKHIVFTNQIMTDDMAEGGDSGSLLIDQYGVPIGLTFADINFKKSYLEGGVKIKGRTFHNRLDLIFKMLEKGENYNNKNYPLKFKYFFT